MASGALADAAPGALHSKLLAGVINAAARHCPEAASVLAADSHRFRTRAATTMFRWQRDGPGNAWPKNQNPRRVGGFGSKPYNSAPRHVL